MGDTTRIEQPTQDVMNAPPRARRTGAATPDVAQKAALGGFPGAVSSAGILALQASSGNSAVSRLLEPQSRAPKSTPPASERQTFFDDGSIAFSAVIPRSDMARTATGGSRRAPVPSTGQPLVAAAGPYRDAPPGAATETTGGEEAARPPARQPVAEPAEGQTVRLPDVELPASATIEERDTIGSTLTYNHTITQTGPDPGRAFGSTSPYSFSMQNIVVTSAPGAYTVTGTVRNPIVFQVHSNAGPGGETDIAGDSDPDIYQGNYTQVVSDLTPNMGDLNGRPPRTQFWARDLTIIHERFHATEGAGHARSGVTLAENWLNTQTAASVTDVNTLVAQVPGRVIATRRAAMTFPGREQRAYGDGAALYRSRATAIKAKGDSKGYPKLSRGGRAAVGALGGAAAGAGIGAVVGGPVGAAVGAGIGALAGGLIGYFS